MIRLLKTEIGYFKAPLWGIVILLLVFTIFALNSIELFGNIVFLKKYLWSMVIGLGSYGLVFVLWMQRVKERHEQIHSLLPLSLKTKKWSRWIFAIMPFTLAMLYIQATHIFLSSEWVVHVGRISAQIGFLSMALASMFIVRDIWFVKTGRNASYKILVASIVVIIAVIGTLLIMQFFNYNIVGPLYIHQEELMFFIWGILISAFSIITYGKRKEYLE